MPSHEEALALIDATEERRWEAEVSRRKGEGLLACTPGQETEAETCLHQALAIARRQEAKALELRAAMHLSRLWQPQGKRAEACELLAPSLGGSRRALTPPTSRKPRHCSVSWGHKTVIETYLTATKRPTPSLLDGHLRELARSGSHAYSPWLLLLVRDHASRTRRHPAADPAPGWGLHRQPRRDPMRWWTSARQRRPDFHKDRARRLWCCLAPTVHEAHGRPRGLGASPHRKTLPWQHKRALGRTSTLSFA